MRIAGGTLKGRVVAAPPGLGTRPTTSALREAVFSSLEHHISWPGSYVVDAFCGSGILGFEALSRGVAHVTFVDIDREVCARVRRTANDLMVGPQCTIMCADAVAVLRTWASTPMHMVFADAPYHMNIGNTLLALLERNTLCGNGAFVVLDHGPLEQIIHGNGWHNVYRAERGGCVVDVLQRYVATEHVGRDTE